MRATTDEARTDIAFTYFRTRTTVLRLERIRILTDYQLRLLLAHEAGHIICQCVDESGADREAVRLLKDGAK